MCHSISSSTWEMISIVFNNSDIGRKTTFREDSKLVGTFTEGGGFSEYCENDVEIDVNIVHH